MKYHIYISVAKALFGEKTLTSHEDAVSSRQPPLNWSSLSRGL